MSLVDSTCIVRSLKAGLFDDGWYPGVFGSRRAVELEAEHGCFTDAGTYFDDALSQRADCAGMTFPATTKLTVAFNINADDPAASNDVIGRWGEGHNQIVLRVQGNGQVVFFVAAGDSEGGGNYASGTTLVGTGFDRRIVVVYDGTLPAADRVAIYVDGIADVVVITGTIPAALNPSTDTFHVGGESGIGYSSCVLSNVSLSAQALSGEALAAAHVSTPYEEMSPERQADWFSFWRLCQRTGTLDDATGLNDMTRVNSPGVAAGPGEGPCVDRSPCKRIEDQSGNARHFIQPTIAYQPDWRAEYQNGLGALVFDGVDDYMYAEFSLIPAFETWVVGKFTGPRAGNDTLCAAVEVNTYRLLRSPDADTMRAYTGASLYAAMGASGPESFHLYRASWAASGVLSVDSDADNTGADLSGSYVDAAGYILGARGGGPGLAPAEFGPCAISSLLLLSAVPTDAEALNAKRYYRTRYGTP